jgi:hypothetical protein
VAAATRNKVGPAPSMRCRYSARGLGGATELEEAGRGEDARRMAKA